VRIHGVELKSSVQQFGCAVGQSSLVVHTGYPQPRMHWTAAKPWQHITPLAQSSRPSQNVCVPGHSAAASMQRAGFSVSMQHFLPTAQVLVSHATPSCVGPLSKQTPGEPVHVRSSGQTWAESHLNRAPFRSGSP